VFRQECTRRNPLSRCTRLHRPTIFERTHPAFFREIFPEVPFVGEKRSVYPTTVGCGSKSSRRVESISPTNRIGPRLRLRGKHRLAAVEVIFDRLEGRASQHIQIADVTKELRQKSDDELRFHLEHDRWPEENELPESGGQPNEVEE
jgi:hypothetical protein